MLPEVREYFEDVRLHLHLDTATERQVISELYSYFQEKVADLQDKGGSERDTIREAIKSFGRPRALARLMYEAYSKGSHMRRSWLRSLFKPGRGHEGYDASIQGY